MAVKAYKNSNKNFLECQNEDVQLKTGDTLG